MANPEHVEILGQGVEVWNEWRRNNPRTIPILRNLELNEYQLDGVDLSHVDCYKLSLFGGSLKEANLEEADLKYVVFDRVDIEGANFNKAYLFKCTFESSRLAHAHFVKAYLAGSLFFESDLQKAIFSFSSISSCVFSNSSLSQARLDNIDYRYRSSLGLDTIFLSNGKIPEFFLKGCGVPEGFIDMIPSLLSQPIQYYSCFISYSSKDDEFAHRLYNYLQGRGVRCWFAPEDLKIGDRIRPTIDQTIRLHDKLLLILSEHSIASQWVEKEVETAFEKERRNPGKTVLFPIRVDDAVMDSDEAWAADIRRTRHIGDFSNWKDHDSYKKAFDRLMRDLKASEE